MGLEIERRFLVEGDQWRSCSRWQVRLRQGYLVSGQDGLVLRVRVAERPLSQHGDGPASAWLTLKAPPPSTEGPAASMARLEFEYPIPASDATAMLALAPHGVSKCRHGLDLPDGDWVLDVYEGANAPLVVAEVELASPDQRVSVPPWCVTELTGRHELSNAALAVHPLQSWTESARHDLLHRPQQGRTTL